MGYILSRLYIPFRIFVVLRCSAVPLPSNPLRCCSSLYLKHSPCLLCARLRYVRYGTCMLIIQLALFTACLTVR